MDIAKENSMYLQPTVLGKLRVLTIARLINLLAYDLLQVVPISLENELLEGGVYLKKAT